MAGLIVLFMGNAISLFLCLLMYLRIEYLHKQIICFYQEVDKMDSFIKEMEKERE